MRRREHRPLDRRRVRSSQDERGVVFLKGVARSDHRLGVYRHCARGDGEVEARDGPVQHIRDEDPGVVELVIDGQIPRTIKLSCKGRRGYDITVPIKKQQRPRFDRSKLAIRSRDAADQHEAALQHPEGGGQAGEGPFEEFRCLASRRHRAAVRRKFDDRRAGPLKVVTIVKVRNQDIARRDRSARREADRYDGYAVRIDIAIFRDRGRHNGPGKKRPFIGGGGGHR